MQPAIAYNYKSRCLLVKEVLRHERCQIGLDKDFQKGGSGRKYTTVVSSQDMSYLLCAQLLHTEVQTCSGCYQKLTNMIVSFIKLNC